MRLAAQGVGYLFLYHRNMRIMFMLGVAAFLLGVYFGLNGLELIALCITITLVFMAEIFNTAIEMMIDMTTRKYHILIKLVKDIAAAVSLIACLNALAVGYALFAKRIANIIDGGIPLCFAQKTAGEIARFEELLEEEAALRQKINSPDKVFVKKISIKGAELLNEKEIGEIIPPLEGHWLTEDDINQIAGALTQAYEKKGVKLAADEITTEIKGDILEVCIKSEITSLDKKEGQR